MHPYRDPPAVAPPAPAAGDDRAIAVVAGVLGALRVAVAVAAGEPFGAEPTIALGLVALAAVGLVPRRRG